MAGEIVTRIRAGTQTGVDRYGNPVYGPETELDIPGAFVDPGTSNEPVIVDGEPVVTSPTVYFPGAWPDVREDDRLRVRGKVFHADGTPPDWRDPWGSSLGGLVVKITLAEGS
jgi:hypothetical protein